jgi:thiamine-monophosphate kinase
VDFRRRHFTPSDIGHKALAASLSDIAAMGGRPRWALLSVGLPRDVWDEPRFVEQLFGSVTGLGRAHGVALVGGDISRTPEHIVIDTTVIGEAARGRAVLRAGARPGDQIFVTGALGGAAAGLRLFEHADSLAPRAARRLLDDFRPLAARQLTPRPRSEWGALLGGRALATAMIDLSDGLSSDLAHLCRESGVGATVEAARIPLEPAVKGARAIRNGGFARALEADALRLALHGGEDYELLFTVARRDLKSVPGRVGRVRAVRVGEITERPGVRLLGGGREEELSPSGFEHFRPAV